MEKKFFSWETWNPIDTNFLAFHNCVLKVDVGANKAGDKVDVVEFNLDNGCMTFIWYNDDNKIVKEDEYQLELFIV